MIPDWTDTPSPDESVFEALAAAAIEAMPEPYRAAARSVALRIEDFPPEEMLDELGIEDPFDLTGLYEGIPLTEKSVMDQADRPDAIWLFRRPILDEWAGREGVGLGVLVSHVLVHELAHHFGWSDEEIGKIAPWWE